MSKSNILVVTHPRSGTHFSIDTLCLNLQSTYFGLIRGQYPSLERLILDHDKQYTKEWESYVFGRPGVTKIFKTHLMPAEMRGMIETDILSTEDSQLIRHILDTSQIVYVYRDGRDTMISWFHYMVEAGGGLPTDLPARIRSCSFSEFLRMPNRYMPVLRKIQEIDVNRATYWSAHNESWLNEKAIISVSFERLLRSVSDTMTMLASALGMRDQLLPSIELPPLISERGRSFPLRMLRRWHRFQAEQHHNKRGVECYPPMPSYARSGKSGGWSEYFSEEDLIFFSKHAGKTMDRLGYT
jgi:Sulfotransferase domain